ncbi:hypothetical protein Ade02nite_20280 [Paractinoplanes deccanensis]|uniref:Uncharacterized protein n=1 Tax=Paractinoplanes deccanensis TaxID=113561 RepID=A0ABQ3Y0A7_9ACTN|nr:hypothetical protein [Actinoplanes deccanensis]GID73387.1 hypothetical protein Ade02nite_20280 [Actinoplanes deccanensis]
MNLSVRVHYADQPPREHDTTDPAHLRDVADALRDLANGERPGGPFQGITRIELTWEA